MDSTKQHCSDCHEEFGPRERHVFKCQKNDKECVVCPPDTHKALRDEIGRHIQEKGSIEWAEGIFGDTKRNLAYFKRELQTDEGMCMEIYGCSFLWKGTLFGNALDSVAITKRVLMSSVTTLVRFKYLLVLLLPFYKPLFRIFLEWFVPIYEADLIKKTYRHLGEFSPVPREMIRAGLVLAERIPCTYPLEDIDIVPCSRYPSGTPMYINELRLHTEKLVWCLGTFIQADSAYYKRTQDPLSNLDKEKLHANPRREILRLFDILIGREEHIKPKLMKLRTLASLVLLFPPIKTLAFEYFIRLDVSQFIPDYADVYFAGNHSGYNFGGKSLEERRDFAARLDKDRGHVILTT